MLSAEVLSAQCPVQHRPRFPCPIVDAPAVCGRTKCTAVMAAVAQVRHGRSAPQSPRRPKLPLTIPWVAQQAFPACLDRGRRSLRTPSRLCVASRPPPREDMFLVQYGRVFGLFDHASQTAKMIISAASTRTESSPQTRIFTLPLSRLLSTKHAGILERPKWQARQDTFHGPPHLLRN